MTWNIYDVFDGLFCVRGGWGEKKAADDAVSAFFIFSHSFILVLRCCVAPRKKTQRENQKISSCSSRWEQATIICGFCDVISAKWSLLKSSEETCGNFGIFLSFNFLLNLSRCRNGSLKKPESNRQSSAFLFSRTPRFSFSSSSYVRRCRSPLCVVLIQ